MGIHLVNSALFATNADLSDRARLVLIAMAAACVDPGTQVNGTPPAQYFGGHDHLILTLFGDIPEVGTREYASRQQTVSRALRELVDAGAAVRIRTGGRNRTAVYRLTLLPWERPPRPVGTVDNVMHSSG